MIVEGRTEYEFILRVFKRFYPQHKKGIQVSWGGGDVTEQERTLHGVHKCFNPLATADRPLFRDKAVVLCDQPVTAQQERKLAQFKAGYPYLETNGQLFQLPTRCLEEYYPSPWTKTYEQSKEKEFARRKADYARSVAEAITKESFENEMPVVHNAIKRVIELAFADGSTTED